MIPGFCTNGTHCLRVFLAALSLAQLLLSFQTLLRPPSLTVPMGLASFACAAGLAHQRIRAIVSSSHCGLCSSVSL